LLYTSGTTGNPKGCVYHHRGAYLNALGNMTTMGVSYHSRYLWTLPMFHCDGWTFTWAVTAAMGTHVCLRKVDPALIFSLIEQEDVTHMLTETYGPATVCIPQPDWTELPLQERSARMARQGVHYLTLEDAGIYNASTMTAVPADGLTIGELMIRGNTVMKGYLKNPTATEEAFSGGWFHTGDLGVQHPGNLG